MLEKLANVPEERTVYDEMVSHRSSSIVQGFARAKGASKETTLLIEHSANLAIDTHLTTHVVTCTFGFPTWRELINTIHALWHYSQDSQNGYQVARRPISPEQARGESSSGCFSFVKELIRQTQRVYHLRGEKQLDASFANKASVV